MGQSDSRTNQPLWRQMVRKAFYTRVSGPESEWKRKYATEGKQKRDRAFYCDFLCTIDF